MAYECSPYRGSEWAAGWGRLLGAAKVAETHVVTSEANFSALKRAEAEGLLPANVRFYTPRPDQKLRRLERKPAIYAYNYSAYNHWQRLALQLVRELHGREHFDLVHQVNVCTFREPGYTWQLDIPYLWGPVGGTQNFPPRFLPMLTAKEAFKEGVRGVANWFALRKPRVRRAADRAGLVIAANSTNKQDFQGAFHRKIEMLLETGLHEVVEPDRARFEVRLADSRSGRAAKPLRLLWSGELQTRKALPVLLRALTRVASHTAWELDVLGDGPQRHQWQSEAEKLGIADRVRFLGRLPFVDAVAEMHSADLFCFTSLRDTSGNVVLEALAAGVPVLCFDHQGVGDMVSEFSGIKIPVTSPQGAYEQWAKAIDLLASNPRKLFALSRGATVQARAFVWPRNHDRVNDFYQRLTNCREQSLLKAPETYANELFEVSVGISHGGSR